MQAQQEIAGALQEAADIKGRAERLIEETEGKLAAANQQQAELDLRQEVANAELEDLLQRKARHYCLSFNSQSHMHSCLWEWRSLTTFQPDFTNITYCFS